MVRNTRSDSHSQAKLKLKAQLGWLDNQFKATPTTITMTVLFEPVALKLGALKPGASKPARDFNFGIQDRYQDLGITPRPRPYALGLKP